MTGIGAWEVLSVPQCSFIDTQPLCQVGSTCVCTLSFYQQSLRGGVTCSRPHSCGWKWDASPCLPKSLDGGAFTVTHAELHQILHACPGMKLPWVRVLGQLGNNRKSDNNQASSCHGHSKHAVSQTPTIRGERHLGRGSRCDDHETVALIRAPGEALA